MPGFPDDRSDMLAPKGLGDVPLLEAVDDLDLIDHLVVLDDIETGALDDQIVQVPRQKLLVPGTQSDTRSDTSPREE